MEFLREKGGAAEGEMLTIRHEGHNPTTKRDLSAHISKDEESEDPGQFVFQSFASTACG